MKITGAFKSSIVLLTLVFIGFACKDIKTKKENQDTEIMARSLSITKSDFGTTAAGEKVAKYALENKNGIQVTIITYGGRIISLRTPDKSGNMENVVLGFNNLAQYEEQNPYFGALIGRYGNRIANGEFSLNGTEYILAKNNGPNSLHGGLQGFDRKVWDSATEESDDFVKLILSYRSKDMEEGFPGNLNTTVTYTLKSDNSLDVLYESKSDKTTVINLTQHAYFNLSGDFSQSVLDHRVEIEADKFVPVDNELIPIGELRSVEGTPFDFRSPKLIGEDIDADQEQLNLGGGYDHCWVLNDQNSGYRRVAMAYHPDTGRTMEVLTSEPGMQFYTGNFLDDSLKTPNGGTYGKRSGFCFETQHYPDSPNQPNFPSVTLDAGATYSTRTTFTFFTK